VSANVRQRTDRNAAAMRYPARFPINLVYRSKSWDNTGMKQTVSLNAEQRKAPQSGESVPITESESPLECVVIRADLYERVKALLTGLDPRDTYPAIDEVFRQDWSDPKMAEYDDYEARKP
jgi:hypothetical protein